MRVYVCVYIYIYIYTHTHTYTHTYVAPPYRARQVQEERAGFAVGHLRRTPPIHPVSITRFLLRIFSPGAGLLSNPFCS